MNTQFSKETHATFVADPAVHAGVRLDVAVVDWLEVLSRAQVQRLIKAGRVTVNGSAAKPAYRLEGGEAVEVHIPPPPKTEVAPEAIPLDVLYEDGAMAAVNKPAGMVVHPAYGNREGTLVNALLARWPQVATVGGAEGSAARAGIVHRLDKDTSGVILIAKTEPARLALMEQFQARRVHKCYLALVDGHPKTGDGRIEAPLGRDPRRRKQMAVVRGGREAVTVYRALEWYEAHTLLQAEPHTGRTHQIRVHMRFIGCPIVSDPVYGRRKRSIPTLKRQFLHAAAITFVSPDTGKETTIEAPLASDLQAALDRLGA